MHGQTYRFSVACKKSFSEILEQAISHKSMRMGFRPTRTPHQMRLDKLKDVLLRSFYSIKLGRYCTNTNKLSLTKNGTQISKSKQFSKSISRYISFQYDYLSLSRAKVTNAGAPVKWHIIYVASSVEKGITFNRFQFSLVSKLLSSWIFFFFNF